MDDFEKNINASDLIDWIMCVFSDWCVGDVRKIVDHIEEMPSAQPEPLKITIDHAPPADELERIKQAMRNTPVLLFPSAQSERKTGKWVRDPKSNRWRCSECCSFALRTDYREECLSDYCSACGAYMKGEQNENR